MILKNCVFGPQGWTVSKVREFLNEYKSSRIIFPLFPVDYFFSHEIEMYFVCFLLSCLKMEHNLFLIIRSPPPPSFSIEM